MWPSSTPSFTPACPRCVSSEMTSSEMTSSEMASSEMTRVIAPCSGLALVASRDPYILFVLPIVVLFLLPVAILPPEFAFSSSFSPLVSHLVGG